MKTFLIVDDYEPNRTLFCEMIRQYANKNNYPHKLLTANDGLSALTLLRDKDNAINVLITDYKMDNMNGAQLLEKIDQSCNELEKVIVMTATAEKFDNDIKKRDITREYTLFEKPLDFERFYHEIELIFQKK